MYVALTEFAEMHLPPVAYLDGVSETWYAEASEKSESGSQVSSIIRMRISDYSSRTVGND